MGGFGIEIGMNRDLGLPWAGMKGLGAKGGLKRGFMFTSILLPNNQIKLKVLIYSIIKSKKTSK
jgi:hypothetical protein